MIGIPVIDSLPAVVSYAFFVAVLVAVSIIDLRSWIIPDKLLAFGLVAGAILLIWSRPLPFTSSLAGGIMGFLLMLLIALAAKGGMGGGDVKLAGLIGFYLGPAGCLIALFIAFVSGAIAALSMVACRMKGLRDYLPYGPFLALGAVVSLIWGRQILGWYVASWLR